MELIKTHRDLRVYRTAREAAALIFKLTLRFPAVERFGLTAQVRNSIRSVCANKSEAWRRRRYPASFRSRLTDAEAEAAESQTWLDIALDCGYITKEEHAAADDLCDKAIAQVVNLMQDASKLATINPNPKRN